MMIGEDAPKTGDCVSTRVPAPALRLAVFGAVVSGTAVVALVAPLAFRGSALPAILLWRQRELGAMIGVMFGSFVALVALYSGIANLVSAHCRVRGSDMWALALGVLTLAVGCFAFWFVNQSGYLRYGIREVSAIEQSRLDALSPSAVVETYFQAEDLSVMYWLLDDQTRRDWRSASLDPDRSDQYFPVAAGVRDLRVVLLEDRWHHSDGLKRFYSVTYKTAANGDPRQWTVLVARTPGGPWRIHGIFAL